jgi:predicted PurR-regulated permease PerM
MKKENVFFVLTICAALLGGFLLIYPYLRYLVFALLLTYLLYPFKTWLERKVHSRRMATVIVILTIMVAIVLPSIYISFKLIREVRSAVAIMTGSPERNEMILRIEEKISQFAARYVDLHLLKEQLLNQVKDLLLGGASTILGSLPDVVIGLFIMFLAMYYLFHEGESVFRRVRLLLPLAPNLKDKLIEEIKNVTFAVVYGQVMTAFIQGVLAGLGFLVCGVSNAVFWGFVMMILSFVPLVGSTIIWVPAGIYLILSGNHLRGAGLLAYGIVVVSNIDNVIKPRLIGGKSKIHALTILLGVFGGLKLFGFMGLFVGPLILALLNSILVFYEEEYLGIKARNDEPAKKHDLKSDAGGAESCGRRGQ